MKNVRNWIEAGFALVALLLVCLFCAYAWPDREFGLSGWVQGIGSILAVGAAAWVAIYQKRNADRQSHIDQLRARKEKLAAVHAIAVAAYSLIRGMETAFVSKEADEYFDERYSDDAFAHAYGAIKAIPLHELGSYGMVAGFFDLAEALNRARRFAAAYQNNNSDVVLLTIAEQYEVYIGDFVKQAQTGYRDVQSDALGSDMAYKSALNE